MRLPHVRSAHCPVYAELRRLCLTRELLSGGRDAGLAPGREGIGSPDFVVFGEEARPGLFVEAREVISVVGAQGCVVRL